MHLLLVVYLSMHLDRGCVDRGSVDRDVDRECRQEEDVDEVCVDKWGCTPSSSRPRSKNAGILLRKVFCNQFPWPIINSFT